MKTKYSTFQPGCATIEPSEHCINEWRQKQWQSNRQPGGISSAHSHPSSPSSTTTFCSAKCGAGKKGLVDSSFQFHLMSAKQNGITRAEIAEIITHAAFYAGWPKAWAAFRMAKEVWADEETEQPDGGVFGLGAPNDAYAQYFVGHSYLKPLGSENGVSAANVTFEPGCRNNWHIHHASKGCAPPAAAGIRSGASPRRPSPPAIRWSSRPRSSTGTAQPRTAGSPTWPSKCPARAPATSGANRSRTRNTPALAEQGPPALPRQCKKFVKCR